MSASSTGDERAMNILRKAMPSIDRVIKTLAALEVELVAKPIDRSYRSA